VAERAIASVLAMDFTLKSGWLRASVATDSASNRLLLHAGCDNVGVAATIESSPADHHLGGEIHSPQKKTKRQGHRAALAHSLIN
jgi:hypothetical protein